MNDNEPKVNPWLIALTVMLPTFMEVLDTTIANVALTHIAGSLSVSTDESTWVLTSYLISNAIVIPCTAWLGQRFGRKNFLMFCVIVFTAASFLCGLATSLPMLLALRVIQGAGGGAFQPIAQSILLESFPKEKHGVAMGVYGIGVVIAPIIGPVLGGWITDNYSWRWIFFSKLPAGFLAIWLIQRFIHDPHWIRNARPARLDVIGFSFLSLWLGCQEVLLDKGQEDDWFGSHFIILMTVLAVVGLAAFVWRVSTTDKPFVDLRVLKNYNFSLGSVLMFFAGVTLYSLTAVIPLFLESLMGYTALESGLAMIPRGLGALIAMPLAGRLVGKIQGRYLVAGGFLSFGAASYALAQLSLNLTPWILFWPLFFSGVAIAFMFVPLNTIALGALKPDQIGNASGIFNLMRNVGGSVGISMVTTLVARFAQFHQTNLVASLTPYDTTYQSGLQTMTTALSAHGEGLAVARQQAVGSMYHTLLTQANLLSYLDNFRLFALLCFACLVGALLLKNVKVHGPVSAH
ncbi:MAG TPA: DHA2 family efflux MFS transporter permease subunit [Candidatus Aquilonibacter sp.]|nr:DHA2 family efflux MFS transporter permease subunit [Candidatus Aquilonibacter sp.]